MLNKKSSTPYSCPSSTRSCSPLKFKGQGCSSMDPRVLERRYWLKLWPLSALLTSSGELARRGLPSLFDQYSQVRGPLTWLYYRGWPAFRVTTFMYPGLVYMYCTVQCMRDVVVHVVNVYVQETSLLSAIVLLPPV